MRIYKKFLPLIGLLLFVIITITFLSDYVEYKIVVLKDEQYKQESVSIKKRLDNLIEAKRKASMAIALSLAEDARLQELLKDSTQTTNLCSKFRNISAKLKEYTDYKNVWIQIINKEGVSLSRSWIPKRPDKLVHVRTDIKEMLQHPKVMETISTGKFSMTFKSMVPIFDDKGNFLGFIEIISHFNSIVKDLEKADIYSLILVDKKYRHQLTKSITKKFIDGYYVVNFDLNIQKINSFEEAGIKNFLHIKDYKIFQNSFLTTYIIKDINGNDMGYYILMKNLDSFQYENINHFLNTIRILVIIGFFLTALTILIFYKRKYDIEKQKNYYQEIIDSSSDIIIVSDSDRPIDVNKAFFEFFDDFKTLEEFEKVHGCVCNLFEEGEGLVQKQMGEYTWVEYVFKHKNTEHHVKITHKGEAYTFAIQVKPLNESDNKMFTLVLTDITQMKIYQNKLEHLSQTDALTQVGNREFFNKNISKEIERAKRYKHNLSLIMIDIDHFKKINDTYGHDIGDNVLIELATTIQHLLRKTDMFCRYGGEEFMIIMPESSIMETAISAERIRSHVEKLHVDAVSTITISIGLTQLHEHDTQESFVKRVDNALYKSKHDGRNRITSE